MKTFPAYWRDLLLLAGLSVVVTACVSSQTQNTARKPISESKAIRLAEEFIRINGYTDVPADRTRLSYESVELDSSVERMLKYRRNSLEPKACAVKPGRKRSAEGWSVIFRYQHGDGMTIGRAVTMDADGGNMRVEHVDFILDKARIAVPRPR